ncbi:MAG: enoyl-CoA hydratase/isomerase family protein [Acidobacteriota bacterium]
MSDLKYGDVSVRLDGHVALIEIHRPPHNHFDAKLIRDLADAFEALDNEPACRALVLASEGKSFCAGADFNPVAPGANDEVVSSTSHLYQNAVRLFACAKPVVAAIQGAAIGGGLGLALVADFRVVSPDARFGANFVKLGIHPGFGLTYTLARLIGVQRANLMFYTGRRINGEEAVSWGLADVLVTEIPLREEAMKLATEIAECAPLAVQSTRATMRLGLADAVKAQTDREHSEQSRLFKTEDHREGVQAVRERRSGRFKGR